MLNPLGRNTDAVLAFRSGDPGPTAVSAGVRRASLVPAALAGLIGIVAQWYLWPEADVSWLLSIGHRMLEGEQLYSRDIVELNLPLIMQLSAAAAAISAWLRLDLMLVWRLGVAGLAVASFLLTWRILRDNLADRRSDMVSTAATLLAAAMIVLPGASYGQREHLIVLGMFPYLAAAAARAENRAILPRQAVLVGMALALASAIKPHYLLALPLVELVVWLYRRTWRAMLGLETLVAFGGMLVLLAQILWQFPEYLASAVPLARRYYGEYSDATLLRAHVVQAVLTAGSLLITGVLRGVAIQSRVLAAGACGAFLGFLLQGQGWVYQFLPAQTFAIMAVGLQVAALSLRVVRRWVGGWSVAIWPRATTIMLGCLVVMLGGLTIARTIRANAGHRSRTIVAVTELVQRSWPAGQPRTMAGLTLSLFPSFPVAQLNGAEWVSRFSCLWLLPGIAEQEQRLGASGPPDLGRRYLEEAVLDDLRRRRPTIVLAEHEPPRVLDSLLVSPAFRDVWSQYEFVGAAENVAAFVRRRP